MYKQHVSRLSDSQLKFRNRICLGIALGFLLGMICIIILSLRQISNQNDNAIYVAMAPAILMPLIFIPLSYSSALNSEIKRRK